MENFMFTEYADDIAAHLLALAITDAEEPQNLAEYADLIDALEWFKSAAQNPYNARYFRVFYNVLEKITDNHRAHMIGARGGKYHESHV